MMAPLTSLILTRRKVRRMTSSLQGMWCGPNMVARTWYPAKVVPITEVPEKLHRSLFRRKVNELPVVVQWYGEQRFSRKKPQELDNLSENRTDAARAARSHKMLLLYQQALSDLRRD